MAEERIRRGPYSETFRDSATGVFRTEISAKKRFGFDPADGLYKSWSRDSDASRHRISTGACSFQALRGPIARFAIFDEAFQTQLATYEIVPQEFVASVWVDLVIGAPDLGIGKENPDEDASWSFSYTGVSGALDIVYDSHKGRSKWLYRWTASINGRYRIQIRIQPTVELEPAVYTGKTESTFPGLPYFVVWRFDAARAFAFNFRDLHASGIFGEFASDKTSAVLSSSPANLSLGQSLTVDPTTVLSSWGADVNNSGSKFPNDGEDWLGLAGADMLRIANRYDLSGIPSTDTVTQVQTRMDSTIGDVGNPNSTFIGPYNGDGSGDPEADAGATMYSRCNVSADNYGTYTEWDTASNSTVILGSPANADVQARLGATFTLALQDSNEGGLGASNYKRFYEYTAAAANEPQLIVTHGPAAIPQVGVGPGLVIGASNSFVGEGAVGAPNTPELVLWDVHAKAVPWFKGPPGLHRQFARAFESWPDGATVEPPTERVPSGRRIVGPAPKPPRAYYSV